MHTNATGFVLGRLFLQSPFADGVSRSSASPLQGRGFLSDSSFFGSGSSALGDLLK